MAPADEPGAILLLAGFAISLGATYLCSMLRSFEFGIPTRGTKVRDRPDWIHEIKFDGCAWSAATIECD
ncbi:MAG TPA: hypothetical protein VNX23_02645 [Bradyrhizobium sp.]|jgi:hypothetical protein|uniref:hypothetical protein n=1 Tax=Bradyrhizobium sp. TaxID=376 RepID=UPI002C58EACF|nr:hypothetical protein [Bradyrhizobium sp.]HXB76303.1 hypothetical protein [Bradyrhizobium sp.]